MWCQLNLVLLINGKIKATYFDCNYHCYYLGDNQVPWNKEFSEYQRDTQEVFLVCSTKRWLLCIVMKIVDRKVSDINVIWMEKYQDWEKNGWNLSWIFFYPLAFALAELNISKRKQSRNEFYSFVKTALDVFFNCKWSWKKMPWWYQSTIM
jgi:hypothetical protein